jgi:ElaA protein
MATESAPPAPTIAWQCAAFADLSPADLYAAMELRQRVFVVEQSCAYLDADGSDQQAQHLLGWVEQDRKRRLIAYARLFPPRVKYAEASIGRVVTHPDVRGAGAGQALMKESIRCIGELGWGSEIRIGAQMYLERFYEGFGFKRVTEPYTEDNIWHVDMRRG